MVRTQILLPPALHTRAIREAQGLGISLGALVRRALEEHLGRGGVSRAADGGDAVLDVLLDHPYDDPQPEPALAVDVDHFLYGAPRRSKQRRQS